MSPLILASGSKIRRTLFENAGIEIDVIPARIDEDAIKSSLINENAKPRDIADALAEYKARKVSQKHPDATVIGSDQVLDFNGTALSKPTSQDNALSQLLSMREKTHSLYSAVVVYQGGKPTWRFVGRAQLTMRNFSDDYIESYVARNWDEIRYCVGGYQLEAEGSRLFQRIQGDYFTVLGIPLIELLAFLSAKGLIDG